jgi:nucleotide-binding universal stress UspA family protein
LSARRFTGTRAAIRGLKSPLAAWGLTGPDLFGEGGSSFKRILLAVTGSKSSCRATELVAVLSRDQGSRVFVLHFYERVLLGRGGFIDIESAEEAERLVNQVCAGLERQGIQAEPCTERSYPRLTGRLIALAASACCADIIVIGGSRGKSPLWAVLRGGVSHEVLHRTTVPVLVVP